MQGRTILLLANYLLIIRIESLQPKLLICKGARVMLTRNLWTSAGLCNSTLGEVVHIICKHDDQPPPLPIAVIVQFEEGYTGPFIFQNLPNCVPIPPVLAISDTLGSGHERQQLPLRLAWSITIHKSQGLTEAKTWIDLGPSEKAAGLAYIALSRVRKLEDLVVEPVIRST